MPAPGRQPLTLNYGTVEPMKFPTIEDAIGNTPLVALQRLGATDATAHGNVILGKLEGNNPAGSVKDLSLIHISEPTRPY